MTEEALLTAYQSMEPQLHTVARQVLGHHSPDIEDALQNALLKAWLKRDTIRCEASIAGWLWRIVRNESVTLLRRRMRNREYLVDNWSRLYDHTPLEDQIMNQLLLLSLSSYLCSPYHDAFILHYIYGFKICEIALMLQRPENTVKGLLCRARKMMHNAC